MNDKDILKRINSIWLCMSAHPDNEPHSEFADRIDDLKNIYTELSERQNNRLRPDPPQKEALNIGVVSGSLPTDYEVRKAANGELCIMTRKYSVRVATFVKGTSADAETINKALTGK